MIGAQLSEDDPLLGPVDLDWVRQYLHGKTRDEFLERYKFPGLILNLQDNVESGQEDTQTLQGMQHKTEGFTHFGLVFVAKKPRNTLLPLMITVGRSDTVDIALNFPTVSKLHAFFYQVGADWVLVDAGSSNGTFVEGLKLKPREPHTLVSGQNIHFGYDVSAKFMLPKNLVDYLFE